MDFLKRGSWTGGGVFERGVDTTMHTIDSRVILNTIDWQNLLKKTLYCSSDHPLDLIKVGDCSKD